LEFYPIEHLYGCGKSIGNLKGRCRILLKRIDMPLQNKPDIITVSLCLYNLYILENDEFSMDWAKEVEKELQVEANMTLEKMQKKNMFHSLELSLQEVRELQKKNPQGEEIPFIELEEEIENEENFACEETKTKLQEKIKNMLANSIRVHLLLAKTFYRGHLARNSDIQFENCAYNDDVCSLDEE